MLRYFLIFTFVVLSPKLFASDTLPTEADKSVEELLAVKLNVDIDNFHNAKIEQGGGYDVKHAKYEIGNFIVSAAYEQFAVDWSGLSQLPFGDGKQVPMSDLQRLTLKGHIPYRLDEKRMWLGYLAAEWAYEKQMDDALSLQAYLIYSQYWQPLKSWQIGAYVNYHPVETLYLPIIEYTYNYPFKNRHGYYGHLGFPKSIVGYFLTPKLRTEAGFFYHQAMVKLAEQSVVEPAGYLQSQNWRASWRTHYQWNSDLELHLGLQTNISNTLTLYDQNNQRQGEYAVNNGVGGNLGFSFRF